LNVSCVPPFWAPIVIEGSEKLLLCRSVKPVHPVSRETFREKCSEAPELEFKVKLKGTNLAMPSVPEFGNGFPLSAALTVFTGKNCARRAGVRPTVTQGLQLVMDCGTV